MLLDFAAQRQEVARMETIARRVVDMQDALRLLAEKDAVWERKDFWRGNSDEFPGDDETIKTATALFADFAQLLDDFRTTFVGTSLDGRTARRRKVPWRRRTSTFGRS